MSTTYPKLIALRFVLTPPIACKKKTFSNLLEQCKHEKISQFFFVSCTALPPEDPCSPPQPPADPPPSLGAVTTEISCLPMSDLTPGILLRSTSTIRCTFCTECAAHGRIVCHGWAKHYHSCCPSSKYGYGEFRRPESFEEVGSERWIFRNVLTCTWSISVLDQLLFASFCCSRSRTNGHGIDKVGFDGRGCQCERHFGWKRRRKGPCEGKWMVDPKGLRGRGAPRGSYFTTSIHSSTHGSTSVLLLKTFSLSTFVVDK